MNRLMKFAVAFVSTVLFASCSGDPDFKPEPDPPYKDGYLVDVTEVVNYSSSRSFSTYVASTIPSGLDRSKVSDAVNLLISDRWDSLMEEIDGEGGQGRISKYCFTYNSVDTEGKPVVLSGVMYLPCSANEVVHNVSDITLYNDYWKLKDICATKKGVPVCVRVLYNQVVVSSDYLGYGVTDGTYQHPFLSYFDLARQSIDCLLAAEELMEKMGICLKDGFHTYNMGMSKGAPVAMAVQKIIENTEPLKTTEKIKLKSTYCCSGPYDIYNLFTRYVDESSKNDTWMAVAGVVSAYYSRKSAFRGYLLEDFFTDEFNAVRINDGDQEYSLVDLITDRNIYDARLSEIYDSFDMNTIQKVLNGRFFNQEGKFNYSDSLLTALLNVIDSFGTVNGWAPKTPLLIEHSTGDEFFPYAESYKCYNKLRNSISTGDVNENVREATRLLLDHNTISSLGVVRMALMLDPAE